MADKRMWNSKLNAKGLEDHLTEDQARDLATHQGKRALMIVEVHAGPKVVAEDGQQTVSLIPDLVELVPAEHEDRIRTFQRALYFARPDSHGQAAFEAATPGEPGVDDAAAGLDAALDTSGDEPQLTDPITAPLPSGDAAVTAPDTDGQAEGPWPGDDGYEAPGDDLEAVRLAKARKELGATDDEDTAAK